tara:strand:- start:623 stop:1561 length:939 start_codon:yes stop_codon:yes gene_type:complete
MSNNKFIKHLEDNNIYINEPCKTSLLNFWNKLIKLLLKYSNKKKEIRNHIENWLLKIEDEVQPDCVQSINKVCEDTMYKLMDLLEDDKKLEIPIFWTGIGNLEGRNGKDKKNDIYKASKIINGWTNMQTIMSGPKGAGGEQDIFWRSCNNEVWFDFGNRVSELFVITSIRRALKRQKYHNNEINLVLFLGSNYKECKKHCDIKTFINIFKTKFFYKTEYPFIKQISKDRGIKTINLRIYFLKGTPLLKHNNRKLFKKLFLSKKIKFNISFFTGETFKDATMENKEIITNTIKTQRQDINKKKKKSKKKKRVN